MGIKIFYFIRGQKKFFYVVKFFFEKLKFFRFLSKIGATYSCEILGFSWKYHIYGGSLKRRNQFRRRPLLWNSHTRTGPWEPQKVPSGPTFLAIFLVFFYCHFLWGIIVILCIFIAKLTESAFFLNFQKKNWNARSSFIWTLTYLRFFLKSVKIFSAFIWRRNFYVLSNFSLHKKILKTQNR